MSFPLALYGEARVTVTQRLCKPTRQQETLILGRCILVISQKALKSNLPRHTGLLVKFKADPRKFLHTVISFEGLPTSSNKAKIILNIPISQLVQIWFQPRLLPTPMLWVKTYLPPPVHKLKSKPPTPEDVISFGNRIHADVIAKLQPH